MMWIVRVALRRPYTFVCVALLRAQLGPRAKAGYALLVVLIVVLAYSGVFNPQDGGGIHIGIGR